MDLLKRNIHMDQIKCQTRTQIAVEDDVNIPDVKPDISMVNCENGVIQIEEIKPQDDSVCVKGQFLFSILYYSKEDIGRLAVMEGKIPFEEKIYVPGMTSLEYVEMHTELEDLTVNIINSRKLNIQALMTLHPYVQELYDEEIAVDLCSENSMEVRKEEIDIVQITIQKNDIFRIKEEIELPQNYPNFRELLWKNIILKNVDFQTLEENLSIKGEAEIFVLYSTEEEEDGVKTYSARIPFHGVIECHGCHEHLIRNIQYKIGQKELEIRPDFDGEDRMLGLEIGLEIEMKLYEESRMEVISDLYGVDEEVLVEEKDANLRKVYLNKTEKNRITGRIPIGNSKAVVEQLLYNEGIAFVENQSVTSEGIEIFGTLCVKSMCRMKEEGSPYKTVKDSIPFRYTIKVEEITPKDNYEVHTSVEELQVSVIDSTELEIKAVLCHDVTIFKAVNKKVVDSFSIKEWNPSMRNELPSMVMYVVKKGDDLWKIGKKYYVSVEQIKELNEMTTEDIFPGDKLFIVRGN